MGTRVAELAHDVSTSYASILLTFWYSAPWIGVLQTVALIVVWAHGCIGVHFWLRNKRWYRDWVVAFRAFAILLPTLALAGFVAAGNETLREAAMDADYVPTVRQSTNATPEAVALVYGGAKIALFAPHRPGRLRVRRARVARLALSPPRAADPHPRQRAAHDHPPARPCWRRCATTAFRTPRCAAAAPAARPAA